jgi:Family of unknown function (DUF6786)
VNARARAAIIGALIGLVACVSHDQSVIQTPTAPFASDLAFLRQHTDVVLLFNASGGQVAVAPAYQGRVMTSTTGGTNAPGFGWLGRAAIAARGRQPHMNVFGGEDRLWLGPEGGQYSLYFKAGDPFDLDHWQVPEAFDWGAWEIASRSEGSVRFQKRMALVNYSGARIELTVDRTVRVLTDAEIASNLGVSPGPSLQRVAFESSNTVTNTGTAAWEPKSGLISIWILGMFTPSETTTIAVPFAPGPEETLGPIVNDAYFGKVPGDRLVVRGNTILFRGDGQYRSKIGLSPSRALPVAGSYDAARGILTLVQYTRPPDAQRYVNSMWNIQREPYKGDVINSYNDGPPRPGKAAARAVLRARNLIASVEPRTGPALYAHSSDGTSCWGRCRSRPHQQECPEDWPGRDWTRVRRPESRRPPALSCSRATFTDVQTWPLIRTGARSSDRLRPPAAPVRSQRSPRPW